jgi:hypothetical protein
MCEKVFSINVQYDKNGLPRRFKEKYCNECNAKLQLSPSKPLISNEDCSMVTGSITNISMGTIPQKNVEGLEEALEDITVCVNDNRKRVEDLEHNIEENEFEFDIHKNVTEQVIKNNKLD